HGTARLAQFACKEAEDLGIRRGRLGERVNRTSAYRGNQELFLINRHISFFNCTLFPLKHAIIRRLSSARRDAMSRRPSETRRRPGRPPKFGRPGELVAVTLPSDVIRGLRQIDDDLAR